MKRFGKYEKQPEVKSVLLQTYFSSLLCLVLCVTMFFGTTYAWFTSEVNNTGNEIYIGILNVDLLDADGNSLDSDTNPLFNKNVKWEPGYTALETVHVVNEHGDLAFRYELTLKENGKSELLNGKELNDVAKWFDVWCYHDADNTIPTPANYDEIIAGENWTNVGRLDEVLAGKAVFRGNMTKEEIAADPATAHTYTIALHMNGENSAEKPVRMDGEADDAWNARIDAWEKQVAERQESINALMGQKIGLNVKLVANQLSSETDAFGLTYDLGAIEPAKVNEWENKTINYVWGIEGSDSQSMNLDTAYQFQPNETLAEAEAAPYRYYHADFVVKADKDVPGDSMALAGYYHEWCQYKNDNWVALTTSDTIPAYEEIRLVQAMGNNEITVNYEDLCRYGNDGIGFLCGAAKLTDQLTSGTTLTVELRLYETYSEEECLEKFGYKSTNEETGRYIVVKSFTHTFD